MTQEREASGEKAPRYKLNAGKRRELHGDQITAMASVLGQNDPDGRIATKQLRETFRKIRGEEFEEIEYEEKVLNEVNYGENTYDKAGTNRMRLVVDNFGYTRLEIGLYFKDEPDIFKTQRQLTLTEEELPLAQELLNSLKPRS